MTTAQNQDTEYYDDYAPETSIRLMDSAMSSWLKGLKFRNQSPNVVTAWMSKQFAQKKELQNDKTQKTAMPFPMVALSVGSIVPDLERRQTNDIRTLSRDTRPWVNADKDETYIIPWPLPVNIPYQIDIWTKTRQDLRYLETAVLARFTFCNITYLKQTFPGYGDILLPLTLDSVDETSDLETGEDERELRKTISVTLQGWIFRIPRKVKTIQQGHVVFIDASDDLIDDQDFLDHYCDIDNYNFNGDLSQIVSVTESPSHIPPNRAILWVSFDSGGLVDIGGQ